MKKARKTGGRKLQNMATKSSVFSSQEQSFEQIKENAVNDESKVLQGEKPQKPKKKRRYAIVEDSPEERKKGVKNKLDNDQPFESTEQFGQPIPELYPELYDAVVKVDDIGTPPSSEERYDSQDSQPIGVKKRRKMARPKKVKTIIEDDVRSEHDSTHESSNQRVGSWVQCYRPECGKWRCLNVTVDPCDVVDKWDCAMNPDCSYNTCEASQEAFDSQDEDFDIIYTSYPEGSIVWAKIAGYPWWPGMMENDPDYKYYCETEENRRIPISYHVVFFDKEVSRAWISNCNIRHFQTDDNPKDQGSVVFRGKNYKKMLEVATEQAKQALAHPPKERLKAYGFAQRYGGAIGRKKKTSKQKKKKENVPEEQENIDENNDSPNSMPMDMISSEEFPAGSESSDNFSQEMRKQAAKKKNTTPKKSDNNVKASKKPVTNKKSKESGTKKAKIENAGEVKTMPSLVAKGAGRKNKTSKQSKKFLDKNDKASNEDTNVEQDLHIATEEKSSTTPSSNQLPSSNHPSSQDKSTPHDNEPSKKNTSTSTKKKQFLNPKKRKLNEFIENQEKMTKEKAKEKSGQPKAKKMSKTQKQSNTSVDTENSVTENSVTENSVTVNSVTGISVTENISKSDDPRIEECKEEKTLSTEPLCKSTKAVLKKNSLKESAKEKNPSSPKKVQSSSSAAEVKANSPLASASMPKLIKRSFKPPSKNECTDANVHSKPKKMPKLKKAQFIQPPKVKDNLQTNKPRSEVSGRSPVKSKSRKFAETPIPNVDDQVTCSDLADEVEVELAKLDEDIENMKKTFKPSSIESPHCDDSPEF